MKILSGTSNLKLSKDIAKKLRLKLVNTNIRRFADGEIYIEINENIVDQPELINSSPYNDGWIACIEFDASIDEVKTLSSEEYLKFIGK